MQVNRLSRRQRGYSIVEIAIVGAIMTILAGLAIGSYVRYQRSIEADVVGSNLTAAIRETRARAMSERVTYRMTFTRSGGNSDQYTIARFPPLNANAPPVTQLPRGWRFTNRPGAPTTILGLNGLPFANNTLNVDFKGDGSIVVGAVNATSNAARTPLNSVIFLQDELEANAATANLKGRAITVFGLTGRTTLWKLLPRPNSANQTDWVSGTQSVSQ